MRQRVHVHIAGLVQGVGFRYATYRQASSLELTGWVCNLPDGRVEAVFEGERSILDRMIEWCAQGPGLSRVDSVECTWDESDEPLQPFEITF